MVDAVEQLRLGIVRARMELGDQRRLGFARLLRDTADRYPVVKIELDAGVARLLACDLEELTMLRAVPPTGDAG